MRPFQLNPFAKAVPAADMTANARFAGLTMPLSAQAPRDAAAQRRRWHRQAALTTVIGMAARAIAVMVRLVTIPLALHLLGPERYGLWLSIGSILAWIGFVAPGLGYGLVNAVSEASGKDDWPVIRRHVSTTVFTIGSLGLLLLALSPALSGWSGLAHFLGVAHRPDLESDAMRLAAVAAALFALSFSLEFVGPLCSGLQEGYLSSIASMGASLGILVGVVLLAMQGGSLVAFALVVGLPPIVANLALGAYVLVRRYPALRPSWRLWNMASVRVLMGFGSWMLLMQIGELAIFQSANVLIAHRFGPGEVPRYAVPAAGFMNIANFCYLIVQPYWPAMKEASMRRDWEFIRSTMSRTLRIRMAFMGATAAVIVVLGPPLIDLWSGGQAVPSRSLLVAMSAYYLAVALSGNYVVLLLSLGLVRTKALLTLMVGACHITAFFLLSDYVGLSAMPIGGAVGVLADCAIARRSASRYIRAHSDE